ncbi:hypothetical protein SNOG_00077 [Parastagonospora nodorum SN15]|uniref:Uncharacterized protein n=1 Tax=Phaeosphaeria nodorum (strain SN15 / ATCC MYA-4574 / FGSC 10173) TaxID=321614 RepID=Q0V7D7_PHANO|nr:hypothetical protein SNOG_00077 [Parastagonospora nodorum SN15]EAT91572.1 hypothetical protein SNOG_00077 [Parastagonospora nodorum SN15]
MFKNDTEKFVGEVEDTHRDVINTIQRPKKQMAGFRTGFLERLGCQEATRALKRRSAKKPNEEKRFSLQEA